MAFNTVDINEQDESKDQNDRLKRIIFRIIPYIPLIILAFILGIVGARIYLRYATKLYAAQTRLIVNDDTQQKNTNLLDVMQLNTRDISAETEREMQILRSRDLLTSLAVKLQLNVQYSQKGYVKTGQYFQDIPFKLELKSPDTISSIVSGEVKIINNKIQFIDTVYPVDTMINSKWGKIRWHINPEYKQDDNKNNKWIVTIVPVASAAGVIQGSLSVKPISKYSSILELTYTDEIPERGVEILNNLVTLYGSSTVDYKSRISANTLTFLDGRLRLVAEELGGVQKDMQSFKTTQGIVDLGAEGTLFLGQIKEADKKMGELEVQLDVLKQIEQYVARRNNTNSPIPATLGTTDPVLTGLLNQLYQTEFELEKTRQISGGKNPQIEVYESAIAKLKPSIITSINNLKMAIATSREQLQIENNRLAASLNKIPLKERLLLDISRQQGIKNAIYTFLLEKREESAIAASAILPNYRVIEKPIATGLVAPVAPKIYTIGTFLALLGAILFIYLKEFSNTRLVFRSQIESRLPVPVIAELSFQPSKTGSPVAVGLGQRSLIGEQFRELRTNLNYVTAVTKEKCKTILITSSIPKEGKSFVAINTAITLTLTGAKVVIIEGDLRNPKISKPLGVIAAVGMSNFLIGKATEKEIIIPHPNIENLFILPAGPIPPNPAELLSTPRLKELMEYLKEHFDYVIIDSPPVGAVTDAKILAGVADATLYIIRHNYTDSSLLQMVSNIHQKNILPNLNIVFNGINNKKILGYNYGQGYGYGYGNGYGYGKEYGEENSKKRQ